MYGFKILCEITKVPLWNFTRNFEPIHRKMCILQVVKSLTNCNDLRVMTSEILDGPLREPECQRHIFNVWHHQCDVFTVTFWGHWWHHNGDRGRTCCNATITTQGLCTPAPGSPRDVGDFNFRPLLWDLDPKFNKSDTLRRHFDAQKLVPGSPLSVMGCHQLAQRYVPLTCSVWNSVKKVVGPRALNRKS